MPKAYPTAVKLKARKLFIAGLGMTSILNSLRAEDGCEKLNPKTLEKWRKDGNWTDAKAHIMDLAVTDTDEQARAMIGQAVSDMDELIDGLKTEFGKDDLKCATKENVAYAISNLTKSKLKITGALDKMNKKTTMGAERVHRKITGTYEEHIERASASSEEG